MPEHQKKILIAYTTAGFGHRRAAEALYNYLSSNYAEKEVKIVDILDYANYFFRKTYASGYFFIVKNFSFIWFLLFRLTAAVGQNRFAKRFSSLITALCTKGFKKLLVKYQPEIILATHFLVSEVALSIRKSGLINSRIVTVITDFDVHPFWVDPEIDLYCVGSVETKEKLLKFGIRNARIIVSGIPVDLKFTRTYRRAAISEKLKLSNNSFTALIMMAGFGLGPIEKIVNALEERVQLLVVCGKNKNLYSRLTNRPGRKIKVFGFIDNIEELMAVTDLIITKPGGLTVSECLAMNLPMVFVAPIYGQETANAKFITGHGLGITLANLRETKRIILGLKNDLDKLVRIKTNISEFRKPDALREICDALC